MRSTVFCLLMSIQSYIVVAQTDTRSDLNADRSNITFAAIYSNNVSYYGQSTAEKLPYVLTNATARLPVGAYFSAGAYKLLNVTGGISAVDLGIGYSYSFTDNFNADVSYTWSIFPEDSPLLQAANTNNINIMSDYNWPWFKTSVSLDYAFGTERDFFLGFSNSKDIGLGPVFDEDDQLSVEPTIEVLSGTQRFYTTYQQQKIKRNKGKGKGANNANGAVEDIIVSNTSFNLLTYNLKLPLTYSRSSYLAEAAYQFSVLSGKAITKARKQQSFISLSLYYQF